MAIVLDEPQADACIAALATEDQLLISAATIAETLIVASRRDRRRELETLLDGLGFEVSPVTAASARRVALAYDRWGKASTPPASTWAIVSPMTSPKNTLALCCLSVAISRKPTSPARWPDTPTPWQTFGRSRFYIRLAPLLGATTEPST